MTKTITVPTVRLGSRTMLQAAALGVAVVVLGGCSGSSLPDTDRVFLSAAGGWDRNRDGVVTCEEWKEYATELFNAADSNGDGSLDRTEYVKIISTDRMFQTVDFSYYDANGDGKVERTEFVDKPNRAFALLDKDNSCRLSANQVAGARANAEQIFEHKKSESGDPRESQKGGPGVGGGM